MRSSYAALAWTGCRKAGQFVTPVAGAAVGYAPLTETERCVLAAEHRLNSPAFKGQFPEAGEDVKVMGSRQGRHLTLTIALAFVDRFIPNTRTYVARKAEIAEELTRFLAADLQELDRVDVCLNMLDAPERGLGGMWARSTLC